MTITDLYIQLFGKSNIQNGTVIDMAEHGRAGGVSTGTPFKAIRDVEEKMAIDEVDASTIYIGKTKMGGGTTEAVWQIKKFTITGTVTLVEYADGNDKYDNIWSDRTSLSYS